MPSNPSYNCSGPPPPISINTDITGQGVVANYVATAGIAVLLIVIYFLAIYQPSWDPFRKTYQDSSIQEFRPNPIDKIFLESLRRVPKRFIGFRSVCINSRVEGSFIKCILAMSDLQIVTGLSILISGFVQFRSGLSTYHWMVIVDLAWFSSLTHLSCLMLLRNYLYNHRSERMWRLFSMTALATLLIVALAFTGSYVWATVPAESVMYEQPKPTNHAICYLGHNSNTDTAYVSMVFSILLIAFGFVTRIIKLHRTVSINVFRRARSWLSTRVRRLLRMIFVWGCLGSSPKSLKRTLLYRPLVAIFLVARLLLDGWSSMILEVAWLTIGFLWGIQRLISMLQLQDSLYDNRTSEQPNPILSSDEDNRDWSFGQVVSVALLLAPLITIIEYFCQDTIRSNRESPHHDDYGDVSISPEVELTSLAGSISVHGDSKVPDDPDSDQNDHPQTFGAAAFYLIAICCVMISFAIASGYKNMSAFVNVTQMVVYMPAALALIGLFGVVLFSLMIETTLSKTSPRVQILLQSVNVAFFMTSSVLALISNFWGWGNSYLVIFDLRTYLFLISSCVFYILCVVTHRVLG